jgi:hypothetical protein
MSLSVWLGYSAQRTAITPRTGNGEVLAGRWSRNIKHLGLDLQDALSQERRIPWSAH